jgi:methylamine dehydrogenase light chain
MKKTKLIDRAWHWLDSSANRSSRQLARRTSRRSFIARLGMAIAGMAMLPLLPVIRALAAESLQETGDPKSCDYWRYCAIDGTLCSCCGGTHKSCPPGAEPSPITWIGTCRNPVDDKDYVISYNDCCGKTVCDRCGCHNTEREKPVYYPSKSGAVLWCFNTKNRAYHCTVAAVIAEATEAG